MDSLIAAFWQHVGDKDSTGCWSWSGPLNKEGSGVLKHRGVLYPARRLSLRIDGTPVPKGLLALDRCGNILCVRPLHLYVGSKADRVNVPLQPDKVAEFYYLWLSMGGLSCPLTKVARLAGVSSKTLDRAFQQYVVSEVPMEQSKDW